jgi:proteasome-associated ATPase
METAEITRLEDEVIEAVQRHDFPKVRRLIGAVAERGGSAAEFQRLLAEQKAANDKLEKQIEDLQAPPLVCGVVLGPSPDDPAGVIVGSGSQRIEVRIAPRTGLAPADLEPGLEAWLNQDRQLVKVRRPTTSGEAAEVTAVLPGGQLEVKGHGNIDLVVEPVPALRAAAPAVGDRVRIDPQLAVAFAKLPPPENRDLELEEVPDVSYDDIGGLDEHIAQVREAIELPYLYHHLFRQYDLRRPKGILLYGPPGCGKTMLAKAIANSLTAAITTNLGQIAGALRLLLRLRRDGEPREPRQAIAADYLAWARGAALPAGEQETVEMERHLESFLDSRGIASEAADLSFELERAERQAAATSRAYFISIKGPELLNKWVGETELSIRRLFQQAKRRASPATPVVMFFDEIEALFRQRGSRTSADMESTVVPQFLAEIDGVEELRDVILIGATNRQDLLDPAILRPGRLDAKIKIDRPRRDGAQAILRKYLTPALPIAPSEVAAAGTALAAMETLIERTARVLYAEASALHVTGRQVEGRSKTLPCNQFVSGALLESVVNRAKRRAVKREIASGERGLRWDDLAASLREEFEQNKDQLVATTLQIAETGLTIEVAMAEDAAGDIVGAPPGDPWLQLPVRPWRAQDALGGAAG